MTIVPTFPSHIAIASLDYVLVVDKRLTECDPLVVLTLIFPECFGFHLFLTETFPPRVARRLGTQRDRPLSLQRSNRSFAYFPCPELG